MKKVVSKANPKKTLKLIRNSKTFEADFTKKERKRFFYNFNSSLLIKLFWDIVKPLFSNKRNYGAHIKLVEKDEVLQDSDLIAKQLNAFFKNAVSALNANENNFITNRTSDATTDPIKKAIEKCKFHPSILLIQKQSERSKFFHSRH